MHRRKKINPHLSLIIPIYNETRRLEKGLHHALAYLQSQSYSWEIILVDDGSTDNSAKLIPDQVSLIRTARNFGKGHAIRLGVEAAKGDYIFFSDIDFSVSLDHLPKFISQLKTHQVVIGSRRLSSSHITQHQPSIRESLGGGFTTLSNKILGLHHTDLTCGFKGFQAQVAKKLFSLQRLNGWAFDSEILFLAKKLGYTVAEIPVVWKNDPLTKVSLFKDILISLFSLIKIRLYGLAN